MPRQGLSIITNNGFPLDKARNFKIIKGGLDETSALAVANKSGVLSNAGKVLDVVSKVATIFDLIATLGTIIRMEQIRQASEERDAALQQNIDSLIDELNGLKMSIESKLSAILSDLSGIDSDITTLIGKTDLIPQIESQTKVIPGINNGVAQLINDFPEIAPAVEALIVPQIQPEVCKSLNSDCFDWSQFLENKEDDDLSQLETDLKEILSRIGSFPYSCGTNGDGASNVAHALQQLTCPTSLLENPSEDETTPVWVDDILEAIKDIPEPSLFVPDSWAIRLDGHRPQLIAGMQEAKDAGSGSASKWEIIIPHPRTDILGWSFEKLAQYFPDYYRGAHAAIATLTDGSKMMCRARSKSEARTYLSRMMGLVQEGMRSNNDFVYTENAKFKTVRVTCRGIAYYKTGRKEGEKPSYRWYFPQPETEQ